MGLLQGKRALITGGGSGIGRAVVERYVKEGAKVAVLELSKEKIDGLKADFKGDVVAIQGSVTSAQDNSRAAGETVSAFGGIDIFIGNAGIYDGNVHIMKLALEEVDRAFDEIFNVNVKACLLGVRAVADELIKSNGNIILTASYSSFGTAGGGSLYVASKHAVLGLIRELAYEFAPKVRVNGIAPGVAPTVMKGLRSLQQDDIQAVLPGTEKGLPLQFMPKTDDYASAYVFLGADHMSRIITGSVITADSGANIRGFVQPAGGMHL